MVGEDEDDGVLVRVLEQLRDQPVDVAVVVEDRALVRVARLVLSVLGIHVLPEPVVHAVGPHLDHREERPRLRREEVLGEREAAVGHLVHLPEEVLLVVRTEVLRVEEVLADDLGDLVLQRRRVGVLRVERRREEAPHHDAVERLRRVAAGDGEDDRRAARAGDEIPEPRLLDRGRHRDEPAVVGVVRAVPEAVDAEVPRRLRRHHARPGRDGDRRDDGGEPAVGATLHEPRKGRQLVAPALEDERRLGAVEPDEHHLPRHAATIASWQ